MDTVPFFPTTTQMSFPRAVKIEVAALQAEYPKLSDVLSRAQALLLDEGRLFVEETGTEAMVLSTDAEGQPIAYHVNGSCTCPAAQHTKHCKHRAALHVYQLAVERMHAPAPKPVPKRSWFVSIHGVEAIRFEGLRALAEDAGLVKLETTVLQASADLAVCQCTATFRDGRIFTDIGDAMPDNVATKGLRPHFIRIAATRATARALRRALNISQVAVEELGQEALEAEREAA